MTATTSLKLSEGTKDHKRSEVDPVIPRNFLAYCHVNYMFAWYRVVVGPVEEGADPKNVYGKMFWLNDKLNLYCGVVTHFGVFEDGSGRPWAKFHIPIFIPANCVERVITMVGGPGHPLCTWKQGNNHKI